MAFPLARAAAMTVAPLVSRAFGRVVADLWRLVQGTAAATVAWIIARYLFDWPDPFFAPIAALVALNTSLGERGLNAIRLLQGVIVGIVVGEVTLSLIGGGFGSMALAVFTAMTLARALGGPRIVVAQAAIGAILTVAIADGVAGGERLRDALVGAGVALVFSQLLFSPEPIALLRHAESALLTRIAEALTLTARGIDEMDESLIDQAIAVFRGLPDNLVELHRVRRASARVARRTLAGRSQRALAVQENENAGHLDLLESSGLLVARVVRSLGPIERRSLQPHIGALGELVSRLANDLGDRSTRQRAADRAFEVATTLEDAQPSPNHPLGPGIAAVRILAVDIIIFAGVEADAAAAAVRAGVLAHEVAAPARQRRGLFGMLRSWLEGRRKRH